MDERSFWVAAPGRGEVRSAPGRNPNDGEVAIRALASGVSRGTEALVFQGRVPESQYAIMRCPFQAGRFSGPGEIRLRLRWQSGRRWAGGYSVCIRIRIAMSCPIIWVVPVPDDVPDARAVLGANMETAVNAMWDAGTAHR